MKIFLGHWNSVMHDVHNVLEDRGHEIVQFAEDLMNPKKLDVALFWNETQGGASGKYKDWRDYVKDCNKAGVRTILYQHGRFGTSRIFPPFSEELTCQTAMLWGEADRRRYLEAGTPPEKLKIVGCPLFTHLIPREKQKIPTVVFCPEHWGDEVEENLAVAQQLRKLKGVNIITKVINGEHHLDWYDNPVITDRRHPDHLRVTAEVLSKADVVVGVFASTFELLAQKLDIPVVIADVWRPKGCSGDERYKTYHREMAGGVDRVPLDKLNETIYNVLKHPDHLRAERKQAVIDDGGTTADPIMEMVNTIENGSNKN